MTCSVLTSERLEACLKGTLPEAEKALVRAHLADPCDACLERLGEIDSTALLMALAGPKSALTASEADRMFAATRPAPEPLMRRIAGWLFRSPGGRAGLAFAMLLLILAPIVILRPTTARWTGEKGGGARIEHVDLVPFRRGGDGKVEPFSRAAQLEAGDALLIR
jgi:anti-sigma factor RsiW